jgi:hypothetical protein
LTIDDVIYEVSQAFQNWWEPIWAWIYVVDNWAFGLVIIFLLLIAKAMRD